MVCADVTLITFCTTLANSNHNNPTKEAASSPPTSIMIMDGLDPLTAATLAENSLTLNIVNLDAFKTADYQLPSPLAVSIDTSGGTGEDCLNTPVSTMMPSFFGPLHDALLPSAGILTASLTSLAKKR